MFSHKILKRFIKDYSLPIQVIQDPYLTYFIDLYNDQYKTKEKFELLTKTISQFNTEDDFLSNYFCIRDNIIKTIESTSAYSEYNSISLDKFNVPNKGYNARDIFNFNNVNKYFMSIDLKKANFQALKYFNKDIVLGCETYEELIGKFTDLEYMKDSKYLRQVIFGNMNPKRQIKIERYITEQILNFLLSKVTYLNENDIRMVSGDEIIFEIKKENIEHINTKNDLVKLIKTFLNFDVDIEIYQLQNIGNTKYFVKQFINKSGYELMCIPIVYHAQVFKKYNNLEINENDLVFYYENQVCKFLNPISFNEEENTDSEDDNC